MSFEYDEAADLIGEGMPKGNKRAGFVGLMIAKARKPRGLQRGPNSYATAQRPKNTPANFDLAAINAPSKDIQRRFGKKVAKEKVGRKKKSVVEKSAKGRFTKEERDELKRLAEGGNEAAKDKLEEIQAAERARKSKQLGKEVKKREPKKEKKTQAERFAEAMRGEEVQRVTIPTTQAPRARVEARAEGDPTLAEEQREKVNAYMRRFGINTISEDSWKKMPRKDRQEYIDDAEQYGAMGRGKGGSFFSGLVKTAKALTSPEVKAAMKDAVKKEKEMKGGRKPTDNQFLAMVKTSYQPTPPPQLEGFQLVVNTPTVDAFVDEATKSVVLTLRGTVPTDKKDLYADANIPLNRLAKTDRYIQDKALVQQILQRYPPDQYEIYLTGHSLGGAIVNQLKRDFPMLKDAQTFNAAFQPYDLLRQQSGEIKRKYVSTDPLYKLGGRLFQNITVVPPKSKSLPLGTIGKLYDTYQGHALANFEGSGRKKGGMPYSPLAKKLMKKQLGEGTVQDVKQMAMNAMFQKYQSLIQEREETDDMEKYAELDNEAEELREDIKTAAKEADAETKKLVNEFMEAADEYERKEAASKQGKGRKVGKKIVMPIGEFKAEHKRLVKALTPAAKELAEQKSEMKKYGAGFFDALLERDPEKRKKIQEERAQKASKVISRAFGFGKPPMKLVDASGKAHRGAYHMCADGAIHSGKTHTKRSKQLFVRE